MMSNELLFWTGLLGYGVGLVVTFWLILSDAIKEQRGERFDLRFRPIALILICLLIGAFWFVVLPLYSLHAGAGWLNAWLARRWWPT